jgi:hypothetical protein
MADNDLPLELDADIRAAIGGAFESHNFLTVGYLGDDGWPHLSHRGTTQVFGPQQLAIWVRRRDDGLAKAMAVRPQVTLFYVDMSVPQLYTFYGRGQVSTDEDVDNRVYENAPEGEQAQDPERRGVALIIELERIVAQGTRNFVMQRTAAA